MHKYRLAHHPVPVRPRAGLGFTLERNGCVCYHLWKKKLLDIINHTVGSVEELVFLQHVNNKDHLRQKQKPPTALKKAFANEKSIQKMAKDFVMLNLVVSKH